MAAPWFTPPRDALAVSIGAALLLASMDLPQPISLATVLGVFRWAALSLTIAAIITALSAMFLRESKQRSWWGEVFYRLAENLGRAEVAFTPPALISIVGFYQNAPGEMFGLMLLWTFFVVVRPVEVVARTWVRLRTIAHASTDAPHVGTIQRVDDPNIIRVALGSPNDWRSSVYVTVLAG